MRGSIVLILCVCGFLGILMPSSGWTMDPLPVPDKNGDYREYSNYWIVVEDQRGSEIGFYGRLSAEFPERWYDLNAKWPEDKNIGAWPIVSEFMQGMILNGCCGNRGIIVLRDQNNKPWLMVRIDKNRVCFVRANSKYIKPVVTNPTFVDALLNNRKP